MEFDVTVQNGTFVPSAEEPMPPEGTRLRLGRVQVVLSPEQYREYWETHKSELIATPWWLRTVVEQSPPISSPATPELTQPVSETETEPSWGERYAHLIADSHEMPSDFAMQHDHYRLGTPKR